MVDLIDNSKWAGAELHHGRSEGLQDPISGTTVERKGWLAIMAEVFEVTSEVTVIESKGEELENISEKK